MRNTYIKMLYQYTRTYLKVFLVLIFLVSMPNSMHSVKETKSMQISEKINSFNNSQKWQVLYNYSIEYIKSHEGFVPVKYYCAAGLPTIGFGHVMYPRESLPNVISLKQAELLVRKDFDVALKYAERSIPNITGSKKLAVAHFIFALGVGRFNRSDLRTAILNDENIDSLWLSYCHYKTPRGKKIRSKYALKIRQWELDLYKK
ncbi:MAG: hypothetical protein KAI79_00720 [Bacteroidales bacterium]|nr:hypothetical protein [Bacteroidales bacterium]